MMRQNETRRRAPVLLMLDVRPATYDRAAFERAVEAVASIATALDRAGRPFEVAWSTGTYVGAPGRRHLAFIMDELAIVEPHGAAPGSGATALALFPGLQQVVAGLVQRVAVMRPGRDAPPPVLGGPAVGAGASQRRQVIANGGGDQWMGEGQGLTGKQDAGLGEVDMAVRHRAR